MSKLAKRRGLQIEALDNIPELYDHLSEVWRIFWMLSNSRLLVMQPQRVQFVEILACFRLMRIKDSTTQLSYLKYLQAMDLLWLGLYAERHEAKDRGKTHAKHGQRTR